MAMADAAEGDATGQKYAPGRRAGTLTARALERGGLGVENVKSRLMTRCATPVPVNIHDSCKFTMQIILTNLNLDKGGGVDRAAIEILSQPSIFKA